MSKILLTDWNYLAKVQTVSTGAGDSWCLRSTRQGTEVLDMLRLIVFFLLIVIPWIAVRKFLLHSTYNTSSEGTMDNAQEFTTTAVSIATVQ